MGQLVSRRNTLPQGGHFSTDEEGPPRYSPHHLDDNHIRGQGLQSPPTIYDEESSSTPERCDSRAQLHISSVYSTMEKLPELKSYANTMPRLTMRNRPTLGTLRKEFEIRDSERDGATTPDSGSLPEAHNEHEEAHRASGHPIRFGWVTGVMITNMCNIWGVLLFLRLTLITSQAGIVLTWVIILLSISVTSSTALSISAIATNGRVDAGGSYLMISRSLGPQIGAPIGLIYSFANVLACALNTVGFAELVQQIMAQYNKVMVDPVNDIRIIGVITATAILCITLIGMEWEFKAQIFFFSTVLLSLASYLIGTVIPPSMDKQSIGIFGYRGDIFVENLTPSWRGGDFFQMFAIFFPSSTGILSGVNICGDLKDPATAIPKGTLLSILWTTLSYLVLAATSGASVVRDASGNMSDYITGNSTAGCVGTACKLGWNFTHCSEPPNCIYGLANNVQVMQQLAVVSYLVIAGVVAASLSSSLGFMVSAPKVFQCLCQDNIYPYIMFFGKGYGKNQEPKRAYCLCYLISLIFILIANLDIVAALDANFFLCFYSLVNFSCFHATVINSPGWRPSFRYYNKWVSLYGAISATVLMFLFTWWAAIVTWFILFLLFGYVSYKKPKINWGSTVQASAYNMALSYSVSLTGVEDHVKNYRPQCLVLTGPPNQRPALVDFVASFTKNISLMICGDILTEQDRKTRPHDATDSLVKWMNKRKIRAFYTPFTTDSLRAGASHLLEASGLGKMKPNTLIMGFKSHWKESTPESIEDYIHTIYDTFDSNYCLCILRMMDGLDVLDRLECEVNMGFDPDGSVENLDQQPEEESADDVINEDNCDQIKTLFQNSQGKKYIDIYWIVDDGGLTLLVPYLLTRRKNWRRCRIRVFVVGDEQNMEESRKDLIVLLKRFRLNVKEVIVMTDVEKRPHIKSLTKFVEDIAPFRLYDEQQEGISVHEMRRNTPWKISDKEFEAFRFKSENKVRLNEIIRRNSQYTALVVVSLPVPQSDCPSALYMAWLDTLTCGLHCPSVLIRGNQQDVLTCYSQ